MSVAQSHLAQFGPAFVWLMDRGVTSARLASLFGTSPNNVRVIAHRSRTTALPETELEAWNAPPETHGVRSGHDEVIRTPARARKLDSIRDDIEQLVQDHRARYDFLNGARALRQLLPRIGFASDARRVAIRALLYQHIAWFLVHSGRAFSALEAAHIACASWRKVYNESSDRDAARGFVNAGLIASQARLLAKQPEMAWNTLDVLRDAASAARDPLGSEYFRQRGVVLFQHREDRQAKTEFVRAAQAMETLGEGSTPAELLMTGVRHTNLLGEIRPDNSFELFRLAQKTFGESSLEASVTLHWAVACGFSADSPRLVRESRDLLYGESAPSTPFGHQATIRTLLTIAPQLGFDARLTRMWVRRALYENAYRDR